MKLGQLATETIFMFHTLHSNIMRSAIVTCKSTMKTESSKGGGRKEAFS